MSNTSSSQATASADVAARVNGDHPLLSSIDAHSERVIELLSDMRNSLRRMADRPPPSAIDEDVQGSAGVTVEQLELSPGDNASPEPSGPQGPPNDEQQQPIATTDSTSADLGAPTGPASPIAAAGAINNNFIASDVPLWSPVKCVPPPSALGVTINMPGFDESSGPPSRLLLDPQVVSGTSQMQEPSAARVDGDGVDARQLDSSPSPGNAAAQAEDGTPAVSSVMPAQALGVPSEGRRSDVEAFRQHVSSGSAHDTLPLAAQSPGNSGRRAHEGDGHAALALNSPSRLVDENDTTSRTGASASAALDATRCSPQPGPTSVVDVVQANGGQEATTPTQELSPPSETTYRPTSELFPGTLRLVIDVGTDGEIHDGDKLLFLGDLDGALDRLPEICAERKIEWTHLYLRIRKPVYKGQDSMLKIMRCLRPYLRCFSGARLIMDEVLKIDAAEHFRDDFARLLFLSLEGKATKEHALLFPLNQLRYLNLSSQMEFGEMIQVIYRSQMLDFLKLGYQKDHGHRHIAHSDAVITLPHHITFPYAMDITTNDTNSFLPSLRAAELTTTDLRLKVTADLASCSTEVKALFARNDGWMLS
ncbi:hypothetical protein EV122DRAFT_216843 [Schizophyllum commune]